MSFEGDLGAAFGTSNTRYLENTLLTFGASAIIGGLNWFRENYQHVKTGLDLYYQLNEKKMVYRKGRGKRTYRRRGYKRRRLRRYGRRRGGLRRRIRAISSMLRRKGIRNSEIKFLQNTGSVAVNTVQANQFPIQNLAEIAAGDGKANREGAKVFIRHIRIRGLVRTTEGAATFPENYIRFLIVRDKVPHSPTAEPHLTDVFNFPNTAPATTYNTAAINMMPWKYADNRFARRWQVLAQWGMKISSVNATGDSTRMFKKNIRVMQPAYYGASLTDQDLGPGQIYLYAWSTEPKSTLPDAPTLTFAYRVTFTDV